MEKKRTSEVIRLFSPLSQHFSHFLVQGCLFLLAESLFHCRVRFQVIFAEPERPVVSSSVLSVSHISFVSKNLCAYLVLHDLLDDFGFGVNEDPPCSMSGASLCHVSFRELVLVLLHENWP